MDFLSFLQVNQPESAGSQGSFITTIITFGLIFLIFYFFIIRPQNKKQKEAEKMIAALKKGDKVVTIGGIHGEITSTKENTVIVRVDDSVKLEINRSAVSNVISDTPAKNKKKTRAKKEVASESETKEN